MRKIIMKRELISHQVSGQSCTVNVFVADDPGPAGACHEYRIEPIAQEPPEGAINSSHIHFQNGPINESGVNGCTNESLLAVVIDRLEGFQAGPFACKENQVALDKIKMAMHWLHHRTIQRIDSGVEGTNQK